MLQVWRPRASPTTLEWDYPEDCATSGMGRTRTSKAKRHVVYSHGRYQLRSTKPSKNELSSKSKPIAVAGLRIELKSKGYEPSQLPLLASRKVCGRLPDPLRPSSLFLHATHELGNVRHFFGGVWNPKAGMPYRRPAPCQGSGRPRFHSILGPHCF